MLINKLWCILITLFFYFLEKIAIINTRRSGHKNQNHWNFRHQITHRVRSSIEERIEEISPKYCGLKLKTSNYIVGGVEAKKNEYPFVVALRNDYYGHFCGGSIITDRWILTAAHCVEEFGIIAGAHEYSMGEKYHITRVILHKEFKVIEDESLVWGIYDIALVKTDRKIRFNSNVNPICLPTIQESESFGVITVAGWGVVKMKNKVDEDEESSPVLRKANLTIISDKSCANAYSKDGIQVYRSFLCAKNIEKSVCFGDSGGPAFQYINGRAVIIGVASWIEDEQCTPNKINVFTKVSYFLDWILLNIDS